MLLGMDEYPYHQITSTFAGVAGTDPAWNDGHYICLSDMAGEIGLASTLRLYQNNDVLDGFHGDYHAEGEVWDVSHPTRIVDSNGRSFEFDHAWAENFTRLTCDGQRGLAHFECVVIQEAQEWTTNPGRTPAGGPHE